MTTGFSSLLGSSALCLRAWLLSSGLSRSVLCQPRAALSRFLPLGALRPCQVELGKPRSRVT